MRFFDVEAVNNGFLAEKDTTSRQNVQAQVISRKTDAFLEEYEEGAYIFLVRAEKRVDFAACIKDDSIDVRLLVEKFTARLELACEDVSIKEISLDNFVSGLKISDRNRFISDDVMNTAGCSEDIFLRIGQEKDWHCILSTKKKNI